LQELSSEGESDDENDPDWKISDSTIESESSSSPSSLQSVSTLPKRRENTFHEVMMKTLKKIKRMSLKEKTNGSVRRIPSRVPSAVNNSQANRV